MNTTNRIRHEPIEDCDSCIGNTLKIAGRCVLHYAAKKYSVAEFRAAINEVEEADDIHEQRAEAQQQFESRAQGVFPSRYVRVHVGHPDPEGYDGENILWRGDSGLGRSTPDTLHADKNCHHLPETALKAYPSSYIRDNLGKYGFGTLCSYCTVSKEVFHDE